MFYSLLLKEFHVRTCTLCGKEGLTPVVGYMVVNGDTLCFVCLEWWNHHFLNLIGAYIYSAPPAREV
jgi:hypothetical protein